MQSKLVDDPEQAEEPATAGEGNIALEQVLGSSPEASAPTPQPAMEKPLVYELFPIFGGNNRFFMGGRCVTGPLADWKFNGCAWTFILIPTISYFSLASRYLWAQVDPVMPVVTALLFVSTILFLLLTSCTDPGIIPRRELQYVTSGLIKEVADATACAPLNRVNITFTQQMDNDGYRWCPTCKIVRPPRASHCRVCDNCVLRFDHHCPFVNNCIGQRNYVFFNGFLVSCVSLGVSVFTGFSFYIHGASKGGDGLQLFMIFVGLPTAGMLLATLGLGMFHTVLIARGRTTKEVFKGGARSSSRQPQDGVFVRGPALLKPRDRTIYPEEVP